LISPSKSVPSSARFANLLAVRANDEAQLILDDTAVVNVYRFLVSRYFGTKLPVLPVRHYSRRSSNRVPSGRVALCA
jgi:hypothetical protein